MRHRPLQSPTAYLPAAMPPGEAQEGLLTALQGHLYALAGPDGRIRTYDTGAVQVTGVERAAARNGEIATCDTAATPRCSAVTGRLRCKMSSTASAPHVQGAAGGQLANGHLADGLTCLAWLGDQVRCQGGSHPAVWQSNTAAWQCHSRQSPVVASGALRAHPPPRRLPPPAGRRRDRASVAPPLCPPTALPRPRHTQAGSAQARSGNPASTSGLAVGLESGGVRAYDTATGGVLWQAEGVNDGCAREARRREARPSQAPGCRATAVCPPPCAGAAFASARLRSRPNLPLPPGPRPASPATPCRPQRCLLPRACWGARAADQRAGRPGLLPGRAQWQPAAALPRQQAPCHGRSGVARCGGAGGSSAQQQSCHGQ